MKQKIILSMKKKSIQRIVYLPVVFDLFHYGHLRILKYAKKFGDYVVCGLTTDKGVLSYRKPTITNFRERKAVLSGIKYVDEIMKQNNQVSVPNLKILHKKFPKAKIILLHGDDWNKVPGTEFIKKIGGEVIRTPYYKRLSTKKIIKDISEKYKDERFKFDYFSDLFKIKDIIQYGETNLSDIISTKADTIRGLQPLLKKSTIEKTFIFNLLDWEKNKNQIVKKIKKEFSPNLIVARSSAINEDTFESSMAGYFSSRLNIESIKEKEIEKAIKFVIQSYLDKDSYNAYNQVLIQKQTTDVKISGVIFTRKIDNNWPYYVINFDDSTGLTDTVTSGSENKTIEIYKYTDNSSIPNKWRKLLIAIKEIENIIPNIALDVEFAIKSNNEVVIFQVRPLTTASIKTRNVDDNIVKKLIKQLEAKFEKLSHSKNNLAGDINAFSDMAFWNPSEIIGDNPNYLDYSLYTHLITDSEWLKGLIPLGYKNIYPARLMLKFGNKPYIDLRNVFNALFVNTIPVSIQKKLINYFFEKIKKNPALHDKIEFDIHYACFDFNFYNRSKELNKILSVNELKIFEQRLKKFTNNILANYEKIIDSDLSSIKKLTQNRKNLNHYLKLNYVEQIKAVKKLLNDCKKFGTEQFARVARLAFIGNAILKSLVSLDIVNQKYYSKFMRSIKTVAGELSEDINRLACNTIAIETFLEKYGHLRPGTYDILSNRYGKDPTIFNNITISESKYKLKKIKFPKPILDKINHYLHKNGINHNAVRLLDFIEKATQLREYFKFEFTKNLSDALEIIACVAKHFQVSRKDIAFLDIWSFYRLADKTENKENIINVWKSLIHARKKEKQIYENISLPPLIFNKSDFEIVSYYSAKPNFITQKRVQGKILILDNANNKTKNIAGKIVVIENADPGYDWIFSHNVKGLITKYGGVASHMAIRSAEFGIPAAIGCGKIIFNAVKTKKLLTLDCGAKKILF